MFGTGEPFSPTATTAGKHECQSRMISCGHVCRRRAPDCVTRRLSQMEAKTLGLTKKGCTPQNVLYGMESLGILLIFIGCLLPVVTNTFNGTCGVDEKLMCSAENLSASRPGLFLIRFNAALPDILTGARTGAAFAFILLINAELIFGQDGLGYLIASTGGLGAYPTMFAAVILEVMLGFAADRLFGCDRLGAHPADRLDSREAASLARRSARKVMHLSPSVQRNSNGMAIFQHVERASRCRCYRVYKDTS